VYEGALSCRCSWDNDDHEGGGDIYFSPALVSGHHSRLSFAMYIPSSFDWHSNISFTKFIRFRPETFGGYLDILIRNESQSDQFRIGSEFQSVYEDFGTQGDMPRDEWFTVAIDVWWDNVSQDSGGTGQVQVRINDELIADMTSIRTLNDDSRTVSAILFFSEWNEGTPQAQHLWIDSIVLERL
jgi:hypothetical protein